MDKKQLEKLVKKEQLSSSELESLLQARKEGLIDFELIDIREPFEYEMEHIVGADRLLPTTQFQSWAGDILESDKNIIIYCRTGNRTGQVQHILKQYGKSVPHLTDGIVAFRGETKSGN